MTAPHPLRRRRDLGSILEATFAIYRALFGPLFLMSTFIIPYSLATGILELIAPAGIVAWLSLPLTVVSVGVYAIASGALIAGLVDADEGRPLRPGSSYRKVFSRLGDLLAATYRAVLICLLLSLTVVGIPWALKRAVRWVFVAQAVVVDGRTAAQALDHAARVVEGHWWTTFGRLLAVAIIGSLPQIAVTFVLVGVISPATIALDAALSAVTLPFVTVGLTLVYFDLRLEKGASLWSEF